jgi:hypothetical protein
MYVISYTISYTTYNIVYDIISYTITQLAERKISYTTSYVFLLMSERQMLFCSHRNALLSLQALLHPGLLKTTMTRIMHGIRMMKGIMLTSSLHHIAPRHTLSRITGSPCPFSVHCAGLECPGQNGSGQRDPGTASTSHRPCSFWSIGARHSRETS